MAKPLTLAAYIALPVLDAHRADAFVRRLLAQYALHRAALRRSRLAPAQRALLEASDALSAALATVRAKSSATKDAAELDPVVDASWAAIVLTLEARAKLRRLPCAAEAEEHLQQIFPDRLKFTQEKFVRQWSVANTKLQQLFVAAAGKRSAAEFLRAYGAEDILEEVQQLHARFADVLGITEGRSVETPVELRAARDAALEAAREFVAVTLSLSPAEIGDDADAIKTDVLSVLDEFRQPRATGKPEGADPPSA